MWISIYELHKRFNKKISKITQPTNIGPQDVPKTSPSNISRASPKDHIWPFRGRPNLIFCGRSEITSRGGPNRTFKGCPWKVNSRPPQDVHRTPTRVPAEHSNLDVHFFLFKLFFWNLFDWPNLSKSILTLKVYLESSKISKIERFLQN